MANEVETGERKHVVVMMWDPFLSCLFWGQNATHKCRKKEWKKVPGKLQFSFSDSLGNFGLFLILEEDTKGSFITHQTSNSLSLRALLVLLLHLSHRMHIQVQFKAFKPNFSTSCCQYFGESLKQLHFRPRLLLDESLKENERLSSVAHFLLH